MLTKIKKHSNTELINGGLCLCDALIAKAHFKIGINLKIQENNSKESNEKIIKAKNLIIEAKQNNSLANEEIKAETLNIANNI